MRVCILLLFLINSITLKSQSCDYYYEYSGPAGDTNSYILYTQTQDLFQIDFCTRNVPDRLTIYTNNSKTDSITFYIGSDLIGTDLLKPGNYRGYCEFDYNETFDDSLLVIKKESLPPSGFNCFPFGIGGSMRLYFRTPKDLCALICKVEGNKQINTIYSLCIRKLEDGFKGKGDTVYQPVCGKKPNELKIRNCIGTYYIYPDSSIKDKYEIKLPKCEDSFDGYIKVSPYTSHSLENIGPGIYLFEYSNSVCSKDTLIEIGFSPTCRLYIPNSIKYNTLVNSKFTIFTAISENYILEIFDRWGNLLIRDSFYSNYGGWDGTVHNKELEGVFIYKITFPDLNQTFSGDITVLR